jgi:Flp pilus assembly protein TadD
MLAMPAPPQEHSTGGVVTASSLRHKIPKKAQGAFSRASRLSRSGDFKGAARELERAVAADPDFAEAHANLGVQYLRLGRLKEAEAELLRSIELNPVSSAAHSNLSAVQIQRGDLPAAEKSARRAIAILGSNERARYLLGVVLTRTPHTKSEGMQQLEYAARTMPAARTLLESLRGR